jgi:hypothetical protein
MNANTKNLQNRVIFFLTAIIVLTGIGCTSKSTPVIVHMPERIIDEFSNMQEHELVSRAWIRRGFTLNNIRTIDLKPVTDASQSPRPAVARQVQQGLEGIFADRTSTNAEYDLVVWANLIDVKVKPGRVKSMFTGFDNMPYIEIEIIITDKTTGLPLVKVIHFRRNMKSLNRAVSDLLADLRQFFTTAL